MFFWVFIYYLLFHKIDSFIDNTGTYIVNEKHTQIKQEKYQ